MSKCFASWMITLQCNFKCPYCTIWEKPSYTSMRRERVIENLKKTGKPWVILFTGGEPLLVPDIIDLCKDMTQEGFKIALDTNLSVSRRVREFANSINPSDVDYIYASCHILDRERLDSIDEFIENILLLKTFGFTNVNVNYVLYPPLVYRFENDYQWFKIRGVELNPSPFGGEFEGRVYPQSYGAKAKEILRNFGFNLMGGFNSAGLMCNAGKDLISIRPDGVVQRCPGDKTELGHIEKGFSLHDTALPCGAEICHCYGENLVEGISEKELRAKARLSLF